MMDKYQDLIEWAYETDATFQDVQDALEHWGIDNSYLAVCKFMDHLEQFKSD